MEQKSDFSQLYYGGRFRIREEPEAFGLDSLRRLHSFTCTLPGAYKLLTLRNKSSQEHGGALRDIPKTAAKVTITSPQTCEFGIFYCANQFCDESRPDIFYGLCVLKLFI